MNQNEAKRANFIMEKLKQSSTKQNNLKQPKFIMKNQNKALQNRMRYNKLDLSWNALINHNKPKETKWTRFIK